MCGAHAALTGLTAGRHLLIEDPACSDLLHLDSFERWRFIGQVLCDNVPRCALHLGVHGGPIYRNTTLWFSSVWSFLLSKGARCTCTCHGEGGTGNPCIAQVWPHEMCFDLANGVHTLIKQVGGCVHICNHPAYALAPVASGDIGGRPPKHIDRVLCVFSVCTGRTFMCHPNRTRRDVLSLTFVGITTYSQNSRRAMDVLGVGPQPIGAMQRRRVVGCTIAKSHSDDRRNCME